MYVYIHTIYLFVLASFSNTQHVFFQFAAFYQIWQACFFHDILTQLSCLWYPIDISPRYSPTFLVFKENLFDQYNIPYFTEVNLISVLLTLHTQSIVAGGLEVSSYTTRLICATSFTINLNISRFISP